VVRGPAALLAVLGAAFAYVLVAPQLPQLHPRDLSALVACLVGLALVVALVSGLVAVADAPIVLVPALAGAGLLAAALEAGDAAAAATPVEAALYGSAGIAFAVVFDAPALAIALPAFVAAIDVAQALGGGHAGLFALTTSRPGDALALDLPDWGTGLAAARLGVPDMVFLGALAAYARRLGMRERAAELGMFAGLAAAAVCEVLLDAQLPTVALIALGYLAPNVDRVGALLRLPREG
jgi:hypothetical protein